MCKILEDMRNEAALDTARETVERMIKKGKLSLEELKQLEVSINTHGVMR